MDAQATDRATIARREIARRHLARRSLSGWCRYAGPTPRGPWVRKPWQDILFAELERFYAECAAGKAPRLIVCVPPQSGKSEAVCVRGPVWAMATHGFQIAVGTYSSDLALEHSRAARTLAHGEQAQALWPGIRPKRATGQGYRRNDTDLASNWTVGTGGRYIAVGRGGSLTGKSPQAIVIDDPLKNRKEAESPTIRADVWNWYTSVVYSRAVANGSGILVMHTRWHLDDLVGRLDADEKNGGDKWRRVIIPAQCVDSETDPLGRCAGEYIDPERADAFDAAKRLDSYDWSSLYQQDPIPAGGADLQIAWFEDRYDLDPADQAKLCDHIVLGADLAFRGSQRSDPTAMVVLGVKGALRYVLHVHRGRHEYTEQRAILRQVCADWGVQDALVERAANGDALIDDLRSEVRGLRGERPTGGTDKVLRMRPYKAQMAAGQVRLPTSAPWLAGFLSEICSVPSSTHDDQYDALAWALRAAEDAQVHDPVQVASNLRRLWG